MSCGSPSPSTDSQVCSRSLLALLGHESWDHLGLREEVQLSGPGRWETGRLYLHGIQGRLWQERKHRGEIRS